jgi:hypothetical protein
MGLLWTMRVNNTTILIFIIDYKWWIWYPLIAVNINSDESCFLLDNHLAICYIAMDDGLLVRHFTCWFYPRIFLTWLTFFYRNRPTFLFRDWNHHVLASPPYQQWVHFVFFFWLLLMFFLWVFRYFSWFMMKASPGFTHRSTQSSGVDLRRSVATFAFEVARATWAARTELGSWELGDGWPTEPCEIWMWRNHELLPSGYLT